MSIVAAWLMKPFCFFTGSAALIQIYSTVYIERNLCAGLKHGKGRGAGPRFVARLVPSTTQYNIAIYIEVRCNNIYGARARSTTTTTSIAFIPRTRISNKCILIIDCSDRLLLLARSSNTSLQTLQEVSRDGQSGANLITEVVAHVYSL
jgi:hypothetical protein